MHTRLLIITLLTTCFIYAENSYIDSISINVISPDKYEELSKFTLSTISHQIPKLSNIIGAPKSPITFILASTEHQFQSYTGHPLPSWANGVTLFPQNVVIIKTPDFSHTTLRTFRTTILHELVHHIQGQHVPLNLTPIWFNEGIAVYFSREYDIRSKIVLSRAIANNTLIPLDKLSEVSTFSRPSAELAYAESASVIEYLIQIYGTESISQILKYMKSNYDFNNSLSMTIEIDYSDFPYFWKNYISRTYRWVFLLDIHHIIWLIIPIMVVFIYMVTKLRNRRIKRSWDEQSEYIT